MAVVLAVETPIALGDTWLKAAATPMSPAQASAAAAAGPAPRRPGTARQLHREVEPG